MHAGEAECRGGKRCGVVDGQAGRDAPAAAAGDEEIVGVDVALGDNSVDSAVEVVKIVARIGVMDEIGKFFAIAGAAARIQIENDITSGRQHLFFEIKTVAIVGEGTAVNFKN